MVTRRFANRNKRTARRFERDQFRLFIDPCIWLLGVIGVAGLLIIALEYLVNGISNSTLFLLWGSPLACAVLLLLFRFIRGYFDDALNEP
jgi:hypothetical protein